MSTHPCCSLALYTLKPFFCCCHFHISFTHQKSFSYLVHLFFLFCSSVSVVPVHFYMHSFLYNDYPCFRSHFSCPLSSLMVYVSIIQCHIYTPLDKAKVMCHIWRWGFILFCSVYLAFQFVLMSISNVPSSFLCSRSFILTLIDCIYLAVLISFLKCYIYFYMCSHCHIFFIISFKKQMCYGKKKLTEQTLLAEKFVFFFFLVFSFLETRNTQRKQD